MPWWFRSFLIILTGLLLLLASDVAARSGSGFKDATALRLAGAAMMGVGVCAGLGTFKQPRKRARKS